MVTEAQLLEVMSEAWSVPVEKIPLDAALNSFAHWDSLGHVHLLLKLEAKFDAEITDETLISLTSVRAIMDYLTKRRPNA